MNFNTIVKTAIFASLFVGSISQADSASGLPTGKRQHKPISISKPIDKATPLLMRKASTPIANSAENVRAAYKLCPDGTMIHPGEKCPEKAAKR